MQVMLKMSVNLVKSAIECFSVLFLFSKTKNELVMTKILQNKTI